MTETLDPPQSDAVARPRPRIRIGALLWGLVLAALAGCTLWVATSASRRSGALEGMLSLDGFGWTVVVIIAIGGTLTLVALAAVIRSLQKRLSGREPDARR